MKGASSSLLDTEEERDIFPFISGPAITTVDYGGGLPMPGVSWSSWLMHQIKVRPSEGWRPL